MSSDQYPDGKLTEGDEGALWMRVAAIKKRGLVLLDFGKPIAWLALDKAHALAFAQSIIEKAEELP
jgi:hypothetical protein